MFQFAADVDIGEVRKRVKLGGLLADCDILAKLLEENGLSTSWTTYKKKDSG